MSAAGRFLALAGFVALAAAGRTAGADDAPSLGDEFPLALHGASDFAIAASADRFLVVWTEAGASSLDVRGRIVRASDGEATGGSFLIAGSADDELQPAVASDGSGFLVVWRQGDPEDLRAARVTADGRVLDPGGVEVVRATIPTGDYWSDYTSPNHPAVGWNGSQWLVAWTDSRGGDQPFLYAARLTPSAAVIDTADGFGIGDSRDAHLSFGRQYLLLDYSDDGDESEVGPRGKDGTGSHIVTRLLPAGDVYGKGASVASDGLNFLVTYECWGQCAASAEYLPTQSWTVEVDGATGAPLASTRRPISGALPDLVTEPRERSSVAFGAGRWVIVREETGSVSPNVFLDDLEIFPAAWRPRVALAGDTGLAIATRGGDVVARVLRFGGTPTPTPTASPTSSATPTGSPTATPSPSASPSGTATPAASDGGSGGSGGWHCSVAFDAPSLGGAGALALLVLLGLARRRADAFRRDA